MELQSTCYVEIHNSGMVFETELFEQNLNLREDYFGGYCPAILLQGRNSVLYSVHINKTNNYNW